MKKSRTNKITNNPRDDETIYITTQPDLGATSGSGFISFSISPTTCSKIRLTFSLCLAEDSVKPVFPHEAANAAPSSRVTCLLAVAPALAVCEDGKAENEPLYGEIGFIPDEDHRNIIPSGVV